MSTIVLFDQNHGTFRVNSVAFTEMHEAIVSSVNYFGRRPLMALLSDMTDCNYFDADMGTIIAALVETEHTADDITTFLGAYEDEWVNGVAERFLHHSNHGRVPTPGEIRGA